MTGSSHIIIGLGGIGSAVAFHLATRGEAVLGFDSHPARHRHGSSHGETRLVRQAYFEGKDYVPLARRAWSLWKELERAAGTHLLTQSGVLVAGPEADPRRMVDRVVGAAREFDLPYEMLGSDKIRERFPGFSLPAAWDAVLEPVAGYVNPELAIEAHCRLAEEAGASLMRNETVEQIDWAGGVKVKTNRGTYSADKLIIAVGPWAPEFLKEARLPLVARRKVVAHFDPIETGALGPDKFPGFFLSLDSGEFYGFPYQQGQGVKIARHDGGDNCTPGTIDRAVSDSETDELRGVLNDYVPAASGRLRDAYTCMYTMTPDQHFVVDAHPNHADCWIATGCSGHAFKFTSVLGEVLADMAVGASPKCDIGFLSASRFPRAASVDGKR